MSRPLPKFCVGELVAVVGDQGIGNIARTEIMDVTYFSEERSVISFWGQPSWQREGWKYEVRACPDFLLNEGCLRKLPPDQRLVWEDMMSRLDTSPVKAVPR